MIQHGGDEESKFCIHTEMERKWKAMAGKIKTIYVCSECGFETPKWAGKCPGCGQWNTMQEEVRDTSPVRASAPVSHASAAMPLRIREINTAEESRYHTGLAELDRVLGGGIVKGSLILVSGEPGIGKSTILLQICDFLGRSLRILYVSGEESARQIKLRAERLGVESENLFILTETDVQAVVEHMRQKQAGLGHDRFHPDNEYDGVNVFSGKCDTGAGMH